MKTNVEKMSLFRLSMMLMKTNDLHSSFHDVDENKGERRWTRAQQKVACSLSSLLTFRGAMVIRHGQDPDGSGRAARATSAILLLRRALSKVVPLRFCESGGDIIGFGPSRDGFWDSSPHRREKQT
jgi:hypothetical protein